MNYIDLLTQEEKPILCRIITGRDFKELFKRNEQEFSKIRKGFRAKSLTEQQALSIAIVNVDKPFIAMWVNTRVDIWLKEIQENIEELEEEGSTHDIALASTMLDSVFANNVDLYMLLRPREQKIWDDTREWLASNNENKLLFVIDEAHMYRGSSGGEVALLIRRLFHKLGISRDRVQFILTTASMPNKNQQDVDSVMKFANELTASDKATRFFYLTGEREVIDGQLKYDIPAELLLSSDPSQFEDKDDLKLSALLSFWRQLEGFDQNINSLEAICNWMYDNLVYYRPFHELIKYCRGNAVSLGELSYGIFPDLSQENALKAVSVLLAIAPLAKNAKGSVLFPARMHMLFKGISGVYACANANCSRSHSEGGLTLGEVYLSDGNLICPHCGSVVYELYNDRRCGALFFKGYVLEDDSELHGIVVDKQTYQIGGFYYPGSERHHGQSLTPARAYAEDPNYVKQIISCPECGWFGLMEENTKQCPFCGNDNLKITREMMRPWGFAPRNAEAIPDVQLSEEYTAVQQPLYSTLPDAEEMKLAPGCKNICRPKDSRQHLKQTVVLKLLVANWNNTEPTDHC